MILFKKPDDADSAVADNDALEGLTSTDCPIACTVEGCCITGLAVCGHPKKGGLQPASLLQPAVLRRYNEARKLLARENVDRRADRDDQFLKGVTNV
jgi:hypothetical protein